MRCTSCGMALKPLGQLPLASAKATCVRGLALSMFLPAQQLWYLNVRTTSLPDGQRGYLSFSCTLFSKPVQLQEALALAGPFVNALASPVMMRRNFGIATTLPRGLPTKDRVDDLAVRILPMLPSAPPPCLPASNSLVPSCRRSTGQ